jgi:hypothetical protein
MGDIELLLDGRGGVKLTMPSRACHAVPWVGIESHRPAAAPHAAAQPSGTALWLKRLA